MRVRRLAVAAALLTTLVAGACGAAPDGPGEQISFEDAIDAALNEEAYEIQVRLVGNQDVVAAFMDDGYTDPEDNARYTAILLDSVLGMTFSKDGTFAADVKIGDIEHAVEMRASGKTMAARGEVTRIAELFGATPAEIEEGLAFFREMGKGNLADALLDGTWIKADLGPMESFFKGMGGAAGAGMPDLFAMQEESEKLLEAVSGMFTGLVKSEFVATEDAGHHHRLTANTKELIEAFIPVMEDFYGDLIPASEFADMGDVPDRDVKADAWIKDGRLSRLELDLTQFDAEHTAGPVTLRIDLPADPKDVSMPDDGVDFDVMEIMGSFFGMGMEGFEESFEDIDAEEWGDIGEEIGSDFEGAELSEEDLEYLEDYNRMVDEIN